MGFLDRFLLGVLLLGVAGRVGWNLFVLRRLGTPENLRGFAARSWLLETVVVHLTLLGGGVFAASVGLALHRHADSWREGLATLTDPGLLWNPLPVAIGGSLGLLVLLMDLEIYRKFRQVLAAPPDDLRGAVVLAAPSQGPDRRRSGLPGGALLLTPEEVRWIRPGSDEEVAVRLDRLTGSRVGTSWRVAMAGMASLVLEVEGGRRMSWRVARVREVRERIERARLGELDATYDPESPEDAEG